MNLFTLLRASAPLFPPPHSTSTFRSQPLHSLFLSTYMFSARQFCKHQTCNQNLRFLLPFFVVILLLSVFTGLMLPRTLPSRVRMWISRSQQGREKSCRFFGTVRFGFLLGSSGCFLDPMVVENLPSWRYTQFFSLINNTGFLVHLEFVRLLMFIKQCQELCRYWLVFWVRRMEPCT